MPPKRKNAEQEVEERSVRSKVARKEDSKHGKDSEESSKVDTEIIKYDEYMEGGIPDALLEGLGFTESESVSAEAEDGLDEEEEEEQEEEESSVMNIEGYSLATAPVSASPIASQSGYTEAMTSYVASQIAAISRGGDRSGGTTLTAQQYLEMAMAAVGKSNAISSQGSASALLGSLSKVATRSPVMDLSAQKQVVNVRSSRRLSAREQMQAQKPSPKQTPPNVTVTRTPSTRPVMPVVTSAAQQLSMKTLPRAARPYTVAPRTVTKGNIVYERMPTGEVIASLIKKPDGSAAKPQTSVAESTPRRTIAPYKAPNQQSMMSSLNLDDCPINEFNVGDVLERSIKATQSMRMLLTSLRDDLRRVGAGTAMITEEQVRKRQEVAEKLAKAYAAYKQSIEDMEGPPAIGMGSSISDVARPVMLVKHGATPGGADSRSRQQRSGHGSRGQSEVIELSESDEEAGTSVVSSNASSASMNSSRGAGRGAGSNGGSVEGKSRPLKEDSEKRSMIPGSNHKSEVSSDSHS